jgi:serine/threonine protein kinase
VLHRGPNWWIKIADFGIAKRIQDTYLRTRIGTPAYLAPEVREIYSPDSEPGEEEKFSFAVDLWAVGVMTYRMVTGKLPFPQGRQLFNYTVYGKEFPAESSMSASCTRFVTRLMAASPRARPRAEAALFDAWLQESSSSAGNQPAGRLVDPSCPGLFNADFI